MSKNKKMRKSKDKKVFRHTAQDKKIINNKPVLMRGGIRL